VNAGQVTLSGSDPNVFTGIFARSTLERRGGPGGNVTVNARSIDITGPAEISALSSGSGMAGNVVVSAAESVRLTRGGSVTVRAGIPDPRDRDDGQPVPDRQPVPADAGTLTIKSPVVELRDGGLISALATRTSGQVKIDASDTVRLVDSTITAQGETAGSGVIDIDPRFVLLDHSTINGLAGGNDVPVLITADVFLTSESQILSDAAVLPPEVDIAGSLVRLNAGLSSDAAKLAEICGLRAGGNVSSFVATGRGGTPLQPGGFEPVLEIRGAK
jgi:hypothetical protein